MLEALLDWLTHLDPQSVNGVRAQAAMAVAMLFIGIWLMVKGKFGLCAMPLLVQLALSVAPYSFEGAASKPRGFADLPSQKMAVVLVALTAVTGLLLLLYRGGNNDHDRKAVGALLLADAFYSIQYWLCQWEWQQYHFPATLHWSLIGLAVTCLGIACWKLSRRDEEPAEGTVVPEKAQVAGHRRN